VIGSAFALGQPKLCRRDDVSVVAIGPTADDADSASPLAAPEAQHGILMERRSAEFGALCLRLLVTPLHPACAEPAFPT
jgi:hypothetical protein